MAWTLRWFFGAVVDRGVGGIFNFGKKCKPLNELSISGTTASESIFQLAGRARTTVYDYTIDGDFEQLAMYLDSESAQGSVYVAVKVDTVTSATDMSASGSNPKWLIFPTTLTKTGPLVLTSDQVYYINDADLVAETQVAGEPDVWHEIADTAPGVYTPLDGKVYEVKVINPDAALVAKLHRFVVN